MKTSKYNAPRLMERTNAVKDIWIKQYERDRRGKLIAILPTITAYSIGFWGGSLGHSKLFWLETIIISLLCWRLLRFLRVNYKLNT